MTRHLTLLLLVSFWLVMTTLLWRSEISGRGQPGSTIPTAQVWEKILTAPDDSTMEVTMKGRKLGFIRWIPTVSEGISTGKRLSDQYDLEGMVEGPANYQVNLEANLLLPDELGRLRVDGLGRFATNLVWRDASLNAILRPMTLHLEGSAAPRSINFEYFDGESTNRQTIPFDDLTNPIRLLSRLQQAHPAAALGMLAVPAILPTNSAPLTAGLASGLKWTAQNDWLKMGRSNVRVYRLQAKLLDRFEAIIIVSRVGELLKIFLPGEITLVNDALLNL